MSGLVSIILINFNGLADLPGCLRSVKSQDYRDIELIMIDNDSSDGSTEMLREFTGDPESGERFAGDSPRFIANERNTGFSPALNQGIRESTGDLVMPLNTDIVLEEGFVSSLVTAMGEEGVGSVSGKLLRFPPFGEDNVIDSVGHIIFANRLAENRGEGERGAACYLEAEETFGTCGAAGMYSRRMLEDVAVAGEYFDEDFFAFWEDLDLDWRARLRGWRCLYVPGAVAYHRRGGAGYRKSLTVEYHNYKNRYLMIVKNDSVRQLLKNLPGIIITDVLKAGALFIRCPRALLSLREVVRLMPGMLRKRRTIQRRRVVPAHEMEAWFKPFDYPRWIRRNLLDRSGMIREEERNRR